MVGGAAFLSLAVQIRGLVGESGILPLTAYLAMGREVLGAAAAWRLPTVFWVSSSDFALLAVAIAGVAASALLAAGRLEGPAILAMWVSYLSLSVAGQVFLQFQWDSLLLESLLVAAFWAPWRWRSRVLATEHPVGRWLVWLLAFKLMFLSGATKLLSGDPTWRDLTALTYHYQTQPLPSWISWYVHRLPAGFHRASVVAMLAMELALPLVMLLPWRPRLVRRAAAAGFIALQLGIAWTGNYGFFNALSILLALSLLDDDLWARALPRLRRRLAEAAAVPVRRGAAAIVAGAAIAALSAMSFAAELQRTAGRRLPDWESATLAALSPWRSINGYGLFRVMTTERPEIAIELSDDGSTWRELRFRYKPGDPRRRPRLFFLHMPRLDWQMWFAALDPQRAEGWLAPLLERLLRAEPAVWSLLGEPQPPAPPRALRLVLYRYRFTTLAERRASGRWWAREALSRLSPEFTLDAAGGLAAAP